MKYWLLHMKICLSHFGLFFNRFMWLKWQNHVILTHTQNILETINDEYLRFERILFVLPIWHRLQNYFLLHPVPFLQETNFPPPAPSFEVRFHLTLRFYRLYGKFTHNTVSWVFTWPSTWQYWSIDSISATYFSFIYVRYGVYLFANHSSDVCAMMSAKTCRFIGKSLMQSSTGFNKK